MRKGVFAVYKPKGKTSYDVIRQLKKKYPGEKIGHGGTLDPLAEGVLVVGVGRQATKTLGSILKNTKKIYKAEIELGKVSKTDDAEGPITSVKDGLKTPARWPNGLLGGGGSTIDKVKKVLNLFVGNISQTPPRYSAIKIKGVPAYKRARRGEKFSIQPKQVTIHNIRLINYAYPILKIEVTCGSGVYIRSLARDIGKRLGCGAYLKNLIRTAVGKYKVENAVKIY